MNFMAAGRARRKHGAARPAAAVAAVLPLSLSLSLGVGVQLTTASLRLQLNVSLPPLRLLTFHASSSSCWALAFCPRALSRRSSVEGAGQGQHQQRS